MVSAVDNAFPHHQTYVVACPPERGRPDASALALAPRLAALAKAGWMRPLREVVPAVTCTAQASILTGRTPEQHGVVANGWLWRDTGEVRFWQQSNRLIQAEPLYQTARRRATANGKSFRCASSSGGSIRGGGRLDRDAEAVLRGRRQQGLRRPRLAGWVDATPGTPTRAVSLCDVLGADGGLAVYAVDRPLRRRSVARRTADLTLVYLPHLDYDPQRFGRRL